MKKIVVTGALGHIGSRLIHELPGNFPDIQIVMIDNMAGQRYCSLFSLPEEGNYSFIEADVLEYDMVSLIEGADAVIQLAAITNAAGSFEQRKVVEYNNFNATKRVAEACMKARVGMIHLSSTSVYGSQAEVVDEDCSESELQPQSPYAETKIKEEKFIKKLSQENDLKATICRFGTIFGTSTGMRFHTAVNKFCWQAVLGQPLTVWTTAYNQKRPYLDLSDAIRAITFIMKNGIFDGQIYNVLTINATVNNIVDIIKKYIPMVKLEFVDAEIMNQLSYNVSCEKLCNKGFEIKGNIETGISDTIQLLRNANRKY